MASVEKAVDVGVPVAAAYAYWSQFETFPRFMEGVKSVEQLDNATLRWEAEIAGKHESWIADITEQVPGERIAWRSSSGAPNSGLVRFQPLSDNETRIRLQIEYEPEGVVETVGDALGVVERRIEGDLERFKQFAEAGGNEAGGWGQTQPSLS